MFGDVLDGAKTKDRIMAISPEHEIWRLLKLINGGMNMLRTAMEDL